MNFTKGLKLPSTRGMKSINDDSAEDNITNQSNQDGIEKQEDKYQPEMEIDPNNKIGYPSDHEILDNSSLRLVNKHKNSEQKMFSGKKYSSRRHEIIKKVKPFPTNGSSFNISPQRVLLYEKRARIGKKDYLVEISRDKLHMFIIAFAIDKAKYFTMQMPIKQAFKLLLELDNSFDAIIDLLYFNYNTLLLPDFLRSKFSPRQINKLSISQHTSNEGSSRMQDLTNLTMEKASIKSNENPNKTQTTYNEVNANQEKPKQGKFILI